MFIFNYIKNWFKWLSEEIEKVNNEPHNQKKKKVKEKRKSFTFELNKQQAITMRNITPIPSSGSLRRESRLNTNSRGFNGR